MKVKKTLSLRAKVVAFLGKSIYKGLRFFGKQASSTPGLVMKKLYPNILKELAAEKPVLLVSGTNGKTSTVSFLAHFLRKQHFRVSTNASGANLLTGLLTCFAVCRNKTDLFVLEVDEATLAKEGKHLQAELLLLTNLFRDQLDRFGEMQEVLHFLQKGADEIKPKILLLNGDDPYLSSLKGNYLTFGKKREEAENDFSSLPSCACSTEERKINQWEEIFLQSRLCTDCGQLLQYQSQALDHLGNFFCSSCGRRAPSLHYSFDEKRMPISQNLRIEKGSFQEMLTQGKKYESISSLCFLEGTYNAYNICSAIAAMDLFCSQIAPNLSQKFNEFPAYQYHEDTFSLAVKETASLKASFGRLEKVSIKNEVELCFLLVKNPAGFGQALALLEKQKNIAGIAWGLNHQYADGRDVSWIWDIPFESYQPSTWTKEHYLFGERKSDLALRLAYAEENLFFSEEKDLISFIEKIQEKKRTQKECIYLVCNYTAMLKVREELALHFGFSTSWVKE